MNMAIIYNKSLKKKSTNTNLSKKENKTKEWEATNKEAIIDYNKRILKDGLFSDGLRSF